MSNIYYLKKFTKGKRGGKVLEKREQIWEEEEIREKFGDGTYVILVSTAGERGLKGYKRYKIKGGKHQTQTQPAVTTTPTSAPIGDTIPKIEDIKGEFKGVFDNKFVILFIGIGLGALFTFLICRAYYTREIDSYKQLVDRQSEEIRQLTEQVNKLINTEGLDTYIRRQYSLR